MFGKMIKKQLTQRHQRRLEDKAYIKAAKTRAKSEVREAAKTSRRMAKLEKKYSASFAKADRKALKQQRKHDEKMTSLAIAKLQEPALTPAKAAKFVSAVQVLAPVVLPLVYRALNELRKGKRS